MIDRWRWRELLPTLVLAVLYTLLWRVPVAAWLVYPFRLFGTFVHELSHGVAALATGGEFLRFAVHADLSGLAWSSGGIRWIVASAGYVGSALCGGVLLVLAARGVPPRLILYGLSTVLLGLSLLLVSNIFGLVSAVLLSGTLFYLARRISSDASLWVVRLLAVMLTLDSVGSLFDLLWLSGTGGTQTDAHLMAQATGIPAIIWGLLWSAVSLFVIAASFMVAFRRATNA